MHGSRLDDGGARLRVHRQDPVQVAGEVQHHAAADGIACHRRARATRGDRDPGLARDGQRRGDVVDVSRPHDGERRDAVERRVGRVHAAGSRVGTDLEPGALQRLHHVSGDLDHG